MKLLRRISCPKVLLWMSNLTLFTCACALIGASRILFFDQKKQLISKLVGVTNEYLWDLPKPLFFYVALGLAGLGLVCLLTAVLGCWTNCWTNYCTLTLYFLIVFTLLIGEFVLSVSISIWPNCLGINLEVNEMLQSLTAQYGIPGNEQFTSAIDLVQTQFQCCGLTSNTNWDTSQWQLQNYAIKYLVVPLSCCKLDNTEDEYAYIDPKPSNLTVCQSIRVEEYPYGRHMKSCVEEIEKWYNWHYILFIGISAVVALVNFFVLLTIIYSCASLKRVRQRSIDRHIAEFERKVNDRRNILTAPSSSSSRSSPIPPDDPRDSIPPLEYHHNNNNKQRNVSTFRSSTNSANRIDYRGGTKAYLV